MRFFRCKSYIGVAHPLGSCGATLGSKADSDGFSLRWVARDLSASPERANMGGCPSGTFSARRSGHACSALPAIPRSLSEKYGM